MEVLLHWTVVTNRPPTDWKHTWYREVRYERMVRKIRGMWSNDNHA